MTEPSKERWSKDLKEYGSNQNAKEQIVNLEEENRTREPGKDTGAAQEDGHLLCRVLGTRHALVVVRVVAFAIQDIILQALLEGAIEMGVAGRTGGIVCPPMDWIEEMGGIEEMGMVEVMGGRRLAV